MNKQIENYTLLEKVGEGQYGNVYKASSASSKLLFAIKVMSVEKFKSIPKLTELTNNEIGILSKINHPNIIKFVEMLQTPTHFYLVYEFCSGGTLEDKIKQYKMINEVDAVSYFKQLIAAYAVLYEKKILHRDLKPTNILFHNGKLKVADFGFCKEMLKDSDMTKTMVGSPIYMAPEILKGEPYDTRADIWSLGVVLYEMLYGRCPYEDSSIPKLITMINNKLLSFPKFPRVCEALRVFIKRMLTIKTSERISPIEFVKYPLDLALSQKDDTPEIKLDYLGMLKFTRNNLIYVCEVLAALASLVNELSHLRVAFMTHKVMKSIWRLTRRKSVYWEELNTELKQNKWDHYYLEEMEALDYYGETCREAFKKCDNSLKAKLELEKDTIDIRYYVESIRELPEEEAELRDKLINCALIQIHYLKVIDKKKPDWQDYPSLQKEYPQKEEKCLKYARYN